MKACRCVGDFAGTVIWVLLLSFAAVFAARLAYQAADQLYRLWFCQCGSAVVMGAPVFSLPPMPGAVVFNRVIETIPTPQPSPTPAEHPPLPDGTLSGEETHSVLKGPIKVPLVPLTEPEEIPPPRKPNQPPPCK